MVGVADPHAPSRDAAVACLSELGDADGVSAVSDYRALLSDPTVDAVFVCTPNDHHIEVLRDVLESGKHCMVEKPLCTRVADLAEVEALAAGTIARARTAGFQEPVLWCGMEYRYMPTIAKLIDDAASGVVGDLRMLTIREHRFVRRLL